MKARQTDSYLRYIEVSLVLDGQTVLGRANVPAAWQALKSTYVQLAQSEELRDWFPDLAEPAHRLEVHIKELAR